MQYFNAISLFSGAMGLDVGLENVGTLIRDDFGEVKAKFIIRACIESDPIIRDTIEANVLKGNVLDKNLKIYGDIRKIIDPKKILEECEINNLDLLAGGPPCQSFSTAGRRQTVKDPRGTLIWEFVRFVNEMSPKFFLMENVRGLMSAAIKHRPIKERGPEFPPLSDDEKPGSVVKLLVKDFRSLGYHVDIFEVNAVNYGAPQLRERVLFIGNKYAKHIKFLNPICSQIILENEETWKLENTGRQIVQVKMDSLKTKPFRTINDAIGDLREENPEILDFSERKKKYLSEIPPGGNWRCMPIEIQKESMGEAWYAKGGRSGWWRRLSPDLPSPCLLTMPNHASTSLCHPIETRALSVKEYLRLQEFPENWIIRGKTNEKYTQIGNAVPVRLGEVAGKVIGDALISLNDALEICDNGETDEVRSVYLKSHIRTRKWYHKGKAVVRHNGGLN